MWGPSSKKLLRVLVLGAGVTDSVGEYARARGYEVVNVDICKGEGWDKGADKSHIDIEADILTWDYQRESRIVNIDMVWASPP